MTQKEYIGFGSINSLGLTLSSFSSQRIFLVTGKRSYTACGASKCMVGLLKDYEVCRFSDFARNPRVSDVNRGLELFKQAHCDTVIAVGGGSVIDMAKLINFFFANDIEPEKYLKEGKKNFVKGRPLIAIPTTCGSGSEATHFAALYLEHEKHSVESQYMLPDVAIVDLEFTLSLPRYEVAVSGMDALSQAIESYWCINSNDESKEYARESIEIVMPNLAAAVNGPERSARLAMARASHLAGKAINITKTTAGHAVSYPLTSFFGIAHGHAVGLTLSSFLVYNSNVTANDVSDHRGEHYVKKSICEIAGFLGQSSITEAKQKIDDLMQEIGLETRLSLLGVKSEKDIELIIENGFNPDRVKNNPRLLTREALGTILYSIC